VGFDGDAQHRAGGWGGPGLGAEGASCSDAPPPSTVSAAVWPISAAPLALPPRTSETPAARLTVQATGHPARYHRLVLPL
jgi:hypothetical protein